VNWIETGEALGLAEESPDPFRGHHDLDSTLSIKKFQNAQAKTLDILCFVVHLESNHKIGHRSTPPLFRKIEEALQKFTCDGGDHANSKKENHHQENHSKKNDHKKDSPKEKEVILKPAPLARKAGRQPFLGPLKS